MLADEKHEFCSNLKNSKLNYFLWNSLNLEQLKVTWQQTSQYIFELISFIISLLVIAWNVVFLMTSLCSGRAQFNSDVGMYDFSPNQFHLLI